MAPHDPMSPSQAVQGLGRPKAERFTRKEQARQAALKAQQEAAEGSAQASGEGSQPADQQQAAAAAEPQAEVSRPLWSTCRAKGKT